MTSERAWWKEATVYQVYPKSFNDSDGDGVGDLPGVVEKVDYLDDLGIDVVWLNPVYESPMVDNGYDISDYRAINPTFGTMDDWEDLRDALHERDIRLIMDLVVNHTSDEHEWFQRSRERDAGYEDFYIWREGDGDDPPNNWGSLFGGPAWTYDEERGEYYLHLFDEHQPDLDWRNTDVREAVYEMMTWWLEKGIDGFRMDVINLISKPEGLPDGDPDETPTGAEHFVTGPKAHEYVREMYDRVLRPYDAMTVGETFDVTTEDAKEFVGEEGSGLDMVFSFAHVSIDKGDQGPWDVADWTLADLKEVTTTWQEAMGTGDDWNSLYLNNHDQPRAVSRLGDDGEYRVESAKMLGTYLHTLKGTPFVYQGEELGMTNCPFESVDEFRDEATIQKIQLAKQAGRVESYQQIRDDVAYWSRDNARTPMQWTDGPNAGFTTGEPWIKVNPNHTEINVERAREDPSSVWHYYRKLVSLRDRHPVFAYGDYQPILEDDPDVFAYLRTLREDDDAPVDADATTDAGANTDADSTGDGGANTGADPTTGAEAEEVTASSEVDDRLLVVLNFFDREPSFSLPPEVLYDDFELLLSNYETPRDADPQGFDLRPYEARVYRLR